MPKLPGRIPRSACDSLVPLLFLLCTANAQSVSVYSELTRIDPFGQPVRADRGAQTPREILSPAIARNATSSFHMLVEGRPNQPYTFQVLQNPENAIRITAYRERYTKVGDKWVPDALEPVSMPFDGRLGDASIPNQTAQAFWVDLFAGRNAPVRRIRIEAQVYIGEGWIVYPMEVRVKSATGGVTPLPHLTGAAEVSLPASASTMAAWARLVCGPSDEKNTPEPPLTIRNFIARNAAQDVRFAGGVPPVQLLRMAGVADRAAFCRRRSRVVSGGEGYLLIRDTLIGARE